MTMRLSAMLRNLLGGLSIMLAIYCCFIVLNIWILVPKWPGKTAAQDLASRAEITLACAVVGAIFTFLARWCLAKRKPV